MGVSSCQAGVVGMGWMRVGGSGDKLTELNILLVKFRSNDTVISKARKLSETFSRVLTI